MPETKEGFIPTLEWALGQAGKYPKKKDKIEFLLACLEYHEDQAAMDPTEARMPKEEAEKVADSAYDAIMQITNGRHYDNFI